MSTPYSEIVQQILGRYRIKNSNWTADLTAEISSLEHSGLLDPWNRPLPPRAGWHPVRDREGEITSWVLVTSVNGQYVQLTVIND